MLVRDWFHQNPCDLRRKQFLKISDQEKNLQKLYFLKLMLDTGREQKSNQEAQELLEPNSRDPEQGGKFTPCLESISFHSR